jgi:hypothetical protein
MDIEQKKKHAGGRPSKTAFIDKNQVKILAEKGFTDREISVFFGINEDTFHSWKKKEPKFSESLKDWKEQANARVERSLYERANGYTHPEEVIFQYRGKVVRARTLKYYPPDTAAAFIWLKNRKSEEWKDKQEIDHGLTDTLIEKLKDCPTADLLKKANALISGTGTGVAGNSNGA